MEHTTTIWQQIKGPLRVENIPLLFLFKINFSKIQIYQILVSDLVENEQQIFDLSVQIACNQEGVFRSRDTVNL